MNYKQEIQTVVGKELVDDWLALKPKVYYKDSEPYGVIGIHTILETPDLLYIFCGAINADAPFTRAMLRDIIHFYTHNSVCLLSEHRPAWGLLKKALGRYGFVFKEDNDILYAYHYILKD